jgi:3-hydroxyisobutyrate dehydrogenase-like beta-hydroxyacid dehydrogenase
MGGNIVDNPSIALLGLGEAGTAIAHDLVTLGLVVATYDPLPRAVPGARATDSAEEAVAGADVVLSVNWASVAVEVARGVNATLEPGQLYAELNTAAPGLKAEVASIIEPTGALFADVALMAPVLGNGLSTPCLVSGSGAEAYRDLLGGLGAPVEVVGHEPGLAAERKLLRSVFVKGMAAAATEGVAAARAAGCEEWYVGEMVRVFETADAELLERLLEGSRIHATRRAHEMEAAGEMLRELGVEPRVATAAVDWLRQLENENAETNAH